MQHSNSYDPLDMKYADLFMRFQRRLTDCYAAGFRCDHVASFSDFYNASVTNNLRKDVHAISQDLREAMKNHD